MKKTMRTALLLALLVTLCLGLSGCENEEDSIRQALIDMGYMLPTIAPSTNPEPGETPEASIDPELGETPDLSDSLEPSETPTPSGSSELGETPSPLEPNAPDGLLDVDDMPGAGLLPEYPETPDAGKLPEFGDLPIPGSTAPPDDGAKTDVDLMSGAASTVIPGLHDVSAADLLSTPCLIPAPGFNDHSTLGGDSGSDCVHQPDEASDAAASEVSSVAGSATEVGIAPASTSASTEEAMPTVAAAPTADAASDVP